VASSSVTFFGLQIGSKSPQTGETAVLMEVVGGGTGAYDDGEGIDGVDTYMSNVALLPVEVAETEYSVRILKSELVEASSGEGRLSGGLGICREYQILDVPQIATLYCEQAVDEHRGIESPVPVGGAPGDSLSDPVVVLRVQQGQVGLQHLHGQLLQPVPAHAQIDAGVAEGVEEPVQVLVEAEDLVSEGPGRVEYGIAQDEAAVTDGDPGLALGHDSTVQVRHSFPRHEEIETQDRDAGNPMRDSRELPAMGVFNAAEKTSGRSGQEEGFRRRMNSLATRPRQIFCGQKHSTAESSGGMAWLSSRK
jgi:hypothetical protein